MRRFVIGLLLGTFLGAAVGAAMGVTMATDDAPRDLPPEPVECSGAIFILADGSSFLAPVIADGPALLSITLLNQTHPARTLHFRRQATGVWSPQVLFYVEDTDDGA